LGFLVWKYVNHLATLCLTFKVWNKLNEALHTTWIGLIAKRYYKFIKPISRLHIGSKMRHFCCKKIVLSVDFCKLQFVIQFVKFVEQMPIRFSGLFESACVRVNEPERWKDTCVHSFPSKRCRCQYGMVATCFKVYILIGFCIWSILLTELY
jgi:hypothetical protein